MEAIFVIGLIVYCAHKVSTSIFGEAFKSAYYDRPLKKRWRKCSRCNGSGTIFIGTKYCPECNGRGEQLL